MTGYDYAIIVALFGLAEALIGIIKLLISKIGKKNGNGNGKYYSALVDFRTLESKIDKVIEYTGGMEEFKRKMLVVADILSYKDADGIPFCYTPRNLVKLSERELEKLDVIISLLSKEHK